MLKRCRTAELLIAFLCLSVVCALGAPTFDDANVAAGNLNPQDEAIVQEITIHGDASQAVAITAVTVRNTGTAQASAFSEIKVELSRVGAPSITKTEPNLGGFTSGGVTITLPGQFEIPVNGTATLEITLVVAGRTQVTGWSTIQTEVRFHYVRNGTPFSSGWVQDGSAEVIRAAGLEVVQDLGFDGGVISANEQAIVQKVSLTDDDCELNIHDVTIDQITLENLGSANAATVIANVNFELGSDSWNGAWGAWPTVLNFTVDDDTTEELVIRVTLRGPNFITNGQTLQLRATIFHEENGEVYESEVTDLAPEMLHKGGLEIVYDMSSVPPSRVAHGGEVVTQRIHLEDEDQWNDDDADIQGIELRNLGTLPGSDLDKIVIRIGAYEIEIPDAGLGILDLNDFNTVGLDVDLTLAPPVPTVDDDTASELEIEYHFSDPVQFEERTFRPTVTVTVQEPTGSVDFFTDWIDYPEFLTLYNGGLEVVQDQGLLAEEADPPLDPGELVRGREYRVQEILLTDIDDDNYDVTLQPLVVKNEGTAVYNDTDPDIEKLRVYLDGQLAGEVSGDGLVGLNEGGVQIPLDPYLINDLPGGHSMTLHVAVLLSQDAEPGRTIELRTRVIHRENGITYEKIAVDGQPEVIVNLLPVVELLASETEIFVGDEVEFTTEIAWDPDGTIERYDWDFGDGDTWLDGARNARHQFNTAGTFQVQVTVTDNDGGVSDDTVDITVRPENGAPVAVAGDSKTATVGEEVILDGCLSYDPSGDPITFQWAIESAPLSHSAIAHLINAESCQLQFVPLVPGEFILSLTVTDSYGLSDTDQVAIMAYSGTPRTISHFFDGGWQMISVPLHCVPDAATLVIGDDVDAPLWWWNAASGLYEEGGQVSPVHGYWLYIPHGGATIDVTGCDVTWDVTINLSPAGWHQIGTPWNYNKTDIEVTHGAVTKTWDEAVSAGWVADVLYGYDGSAYFSAETLTPWMGYWAKALVDDLGLKLSIDQMSPTAATHIYGLMAEGTVPQDLPPLPAEVPVPKSTLSIKNVPNPIRDVNTTTFVVEGETAWQVERIRVAIYDLSGRLIYEDEEDGTTLIWHTQSEDGAFLANGVYLYRVWLGVGDQWVLTDVRKLAILR